MTVFDALLAFFAAAATSLAVVPIVARLSARLGAVDAPDGRRKHQAGAVPLGGGLAIAIASLVGLIVAIAILGGRDLPLATGAWSAAIPSALVLLLVGLIDDTIGLTGIYKLMGQVFAASLLAAAGFRFESINLLGWTIPLGDFGIPFSIFFCLGAMNAFNLIDGADGLASSIGAVVCLTLGIIAGFQGAAIASLASFALSGALVGFLRYNAPPARIYLGDTGSMLIGWLVAAVAIRSSIKEQAAVALSVPIAICAIPILDAVAALVRRITTGQSVFTADRGHLHHALLLRGWTVGQTAALAAGLTAITCLGAIASYFTRADAFALLSLASVVMALATARIFGHSELALLATHFRSLGRGALRRVRPAADDSADHVVQLQGRRQWNLIWSALREAATVHDLVSVRLNINIPHLHESFYASWKASGGASEDNVWRIAMPLHVAGRPIGRLLIAGRAGRDNLTAVQQALDYLEPIEAEMTRLVEDAAPEPIPIRLDSELRCHSAGEAPPIRSPREATPTPM